ncbi:flagellar associated protein [Cardiosporidium cionae]|uniref:Flagellar associated protein n=1 Tax=Cardiosporidium cionae TaxID=476202 RepID=A0ABQ7J4Y8_9APIC|nr:flagellar associated protein [Cardiosporidium cionae]|eukprot:KAF8819086.1 flagellar associated protein [Cardiosporidium cionae]
MQQFEKQVFQDYDEHISKKAGMILKKVVFHRALQTQRTMKNHSTQSKIDVATQISSKEVHVSIGTDKLASPTTYNRYVYTKISEQIESAIRIQKVWRGYLTRKLFFCFKNTSLHQVSLPAAETDDEPEKIMQAPTANKYCGVRCWNDQKSCFLFDRQNECDKKTFQFKKPIKPVKGFNISDSINSSKLMRCPNLPLLFNKRQSRCHFIASKSLPLCWKLTNGDIAVVQTAKTRRNKEWFFLYKQLCQANVTPDERKKILVTLQLSARNFPNDKSTKLISLTNRELHCLNIGRPWALMHGLRERIKAAFYNFVEEENI